MYTIKHAGLFRLCNSAGDNHYNLLFASVVDLFSHFYYSTDSVCFISCSILKIPTTSPFSFNSLLAMGVVLLDTVVVDVELACVASRQQYVREHRGRASYTQVSNSLILLPTLPTPMPCSVWTEESSCTVLNSTIVAEINCTYSCGSECWKSSKYPCLQVFVSLNTSGKVVRLSHNEEAQDTNPEVRQRTCLNVTCLTVTLYFIILLQLQ